LSGARHQNPDCEHKGHEKQAYERKVPEKSRTGSRSVLVQDLVTACHENRKTPISKPPANAQRPNVQAETTRTRTRRSAFSWDRSVIAAAPLRSNCWGVLYGRAVTGRPLVKPTPQFGPGQSRLRHRSHTVPPNQKGPHFRDPLAGTNLFVMKSSPDKSQVSVFHRH
jgi:hypothetical protein